MIINKIIHNYDIFQLDIENIALKKNKVIGLIGENGAGKTTLMDILSHMIVANQAFQVTDYNEQDILYIPSDLTPYEFLTVQEFCDIVIDYSILAITSEEVIAKMKLTDKKDLKVSKLSQGMKKKLSLINLFLNNYSLVILDEPFNSIDLKYSYQIKEIVLNLKENSTVLISSHIVDSLIDICDEFIYLENGTVKKTFENSGNKEELESELFG